MHARVVGIHRRLWAFDDVLGSYFLVRLAHELTPLLDRLIQASFDRCSQ